MLCGSRELVPGLDKDAPLQTRHVGNDLQVFSPRGAKHKGSNVLERAQFCYYGSGTCLEFL